MRQLRGRTPRKIDNVVRYLVNQTRGGEMKICPKCSLLSPDETIMCDCGYPFDRDASIRARLGGYQPRMEREKPRGIPWRVNWAGMFFGGLPFFVIVLHRTANGLPTPDALRLGRWAGAVAGLLIARWIYRRRSRPG